MIELLIVDDDPIVGQLTSDLLHDAGFNVHLLPSGNEVVDFCKKNKPRAVIMDIMMPGLDGITLCGMIKQEPQLKDTKVIIVSGKIFPIDKERAHKQGADLFIEKPYDVDEMASKIIQIVGPPSKQETTADSFQASSPDTVFEVQIWGGRGLSPAVSQTNSRYGTRTACVSVRLRNGATLILDAGTGIIPISRFQQDQAPDELHLILTHLHMDHIQGLGLFKALQSEQTTIHIYGPNDPGKKLTEMLDSIFQSILSPMASLPKAKIHIHELIEGNLTILPGLELVCIYTLHPGTTLGISLEMEGKKIVYCPDSEIVGEDATAFQDYDEKLVQHCKNADLLIHDAQFNDEDYEKNRMQGHSSATHALELALKAGAKQLVLFHLHPDYMDEKIRAMEDHCKQILESKKSSLRCAAAVEGMKIAI